MAKILVADDEPYLVALLQDIIEQIGHEVIATMNGVEVLDLAIRKKPDLIILDIKFPDISGFNICMQLKQNKKTANIPILMCTVENMRSDVETAFKLGASGYIIKPVKKEILIQKIQGILTVEKTK